MGISQMLGNGIDVGRNKVSKNLHCLCQGRILRRHEAALRTGPSAYLSAALPEVQEPRLSQIRPPGWSVEESRISRSRA